ncbi:hypothetical protein GCU60_13050 [Blastococcus saxobsidens]|uniref:DUF3093 domain-containing protein n=1 Tax=Blastococcus saxobsidens TaxID=138336 RepID=A0A6L9W3V8_9ACTN|nr:hypothetical protein [Blastococcus saxobsidens]NEK86673.1 hypothetical protein [Blastococcus saxobsidens]
MAARERNRSRPPQAAVDRARRLHVEQVRGHRFLVGWGPKRSATVVPAPLRYWQYRSAGPVALAVAVAVVAVWVGLFAWRGGWAAAQDELVLAVPAGLAVFLVNTRRLTVSDHGVSFDVAGTRTDPAAVVPSALVQAVRTGPAPADWPKPRKRGAWWPGRTRVVVRHLTDDGEQSFTFWARDADAFADAVGVPLSR